jgi:hypothetical protein
MNKEFERFEYSASKLIGQNLTNIVQDEECEDYVGYSFQIYKLNLKFRNAKTTPKKVGQFVTLWKRNAEKKTEPYTENEQFDFFIIVTEQGENYGFFVFPKQILCEKYVLTTSKAEGKRGFRVYPPWIQTENKQAEKTQSWQINYFIDLNNKGHRDIAKFKSMVQV